jgi:hypothetical protein
MTREELDEILKGLQTKTVKDEFVPSADATLSLYAAQNGGSLSVSKIEALRMSGNVLFARTVKKETFAIPLAHVFGIAMDAAPGGGSRKPAGFV